MAALTLKKVEWNGLAALALQEAAGPDLLEIAQEVTTGAAELWAIQDHGLVVTRLEIVPDCIPELVIVAGAGIGAKHVFSCFVEFARIRGYIVRVHTRRPGLARILYSLDFEYSHLDTGGYNVFKWRPM